MDLMWCFRPERLSRVRPHWSHVAGFLDADADEDDPEDLSPFG